MQYNEMKLGITGMNKYAKSIHLYTNKVDKYEDK